MPQDFSALQDANEYLNRTVSVPTGATVDPNYRSCDYN